MLSIALQSKLFLKPSNFNKTKRFNQTHSSASSTSSFSYGSNSRTPSSSNFSSGYYSPAIYTSQWDESSGVETEQNQSVIPGLLYVCVVFIWFFIFLLPISLCFQDFVITLIALIALDHHILTNELNKFLSCWFWLNQNKAILFFNVKQWNS